MKAIISECGKYRYLLTREIKDEDGNRISERVITFIMLNPSTADAETDDPTIRRCKDFARRFNCGYLQVVNLFAYRATNPKELRRDDIDPIGDNHTHVIEALEHAIDWNHSRTGIVVMAWGNHGAYMEQDEAMMGWIDSLGIQPHCLGETKQGQPKHPLYLKKDSCLQILGKFYGKYLTKEKQNAETK